MASSRSSKSSVSQLFLVLWYKQPRMPVGVPLKNQSNPVWFQVSEGEGSNVFRIQGEVGGTVTYHGPKFLLFLRSTTVGQTLVLHSRQR